MNMKAFFIMDGRAAVCMSGKKHSKLIEEATIKKYKRTTAAAAQSD